MPSPKPEVLLHHFAYFQKYLPKIITWISINVLAVWYMAITTTVVRNFTMVFKIQIFLAISLKLAQR